MMVLYRTVRFQFAVVVVVVVGWRFVSHPPIPTYCLSNAQGSNCNYSMSAFFRQISKNVQEKAKALSSLVPVKNEDDSWNFCKTCCCHDHVVEEFSQA